MASASSPTSSRCSRPIRRDNSPDAMALVRSRISFTGRVTDRVISKEPGCYAPYPETQRQESTTRSQRLRR